MDNNGDTFYVEVAVSTTPITEAMFRDFEEGKITLQNFEAEAIKKESEIIASMNGKNEEELKELNNNLMYLRRFHRSKLAELKNNLGYSVLNIGLVYRIVQDPNGLAILYMILDPRNPIYTYAYYDDLKARLQYNEIKEGLSAVAGTFEDHLSSIDETLDKIFVLYNNHRKGINYYYA